MTVSVCDELHVCDFAEARGSADPTADIIQGGASFAEAAIERSIALAQSKGRQGVSTPERIIRLLASLLHLMLPMRCVFILFTHRLL